jgi:nucleotide-binding universal stress UspA family protein
VFTVALDVTTTGSSADTAAFAEAISAKAREAGIDFRVITSHSHAIGIHEVVAEHARLHDLVVIGVCDGAILGERQIAEHLLFESGRPVLIVPTDYAESYRSDTVAVAWDNSAAAARALGDARALIHNATVFLTIDGDKQIESDIDGTELVEAAARRGLSARLVTTEKNERTIAEALQEEALAQGADLLAMGAYGHSRLRRFVLGSATQGILERPAMPVLLSH